MVDETVQVCGEASKLGRVDIAKLFTPTALHLLHLTCHAPHRLQTPADRPQLNGHKQQHNDCQAYDQRAPETVDLGLKRRKVCRDVKA